MFSVLKLYEKRYRHGHVRERGTDRQIEVIIFADRAKIVFYCRT